MKKQLADDMVKFISPIREKVNGILQDEKYLQKVMQQGAEKAIKSAETTIKLVREAIGLNYYKTRSAFLNNPAGYFLRIPCHAFVFAQLM